MESLSFDDLGLNEKTLSAIQSKGFLNPTPIQCLAIPRLLEGETNLIARARTGTGKTAAFGLPLVQTIQSQKQVPQALILTPTRELALQVCTEIESFADKRIIRMIPIYGGQSMREQLRALKQGVEIVVGTPGRIKDHLKRGTLKLEELDFFILDEADEMLDMGFREDIEDIFAKANPLSRKLLFSATMPQEILNIAQSFMGDYDIIEEESNPQQKILTEQRFFIARESEKIHALIRLIDNSENFYGLIFTQTKSDADRLAKELDENGYNVATLHGDVPQNMREKILDRFRKKTLTILTATDVAARGIDIEGLTHVINYSLPFDIQTYIHRIGRTGRAGLEGLAYTLVRPEEQRKLIFLRKAIRQAIKAELKEGSIPTIEQILDNKYNRLYEQIQDTLQKKENDLTKTGKNQSLIFQKMAVNLCEQYDPMSALETVLRITCGTLFDEKRYGFIQAHKSFSEHEERNGRNSRDKRGKSTVQHGQVRLYVGLGRKQGFNAREIAYYLGRLLNIPERLVDNIEITPSFSLVSLPAHAGKDAIERSKRDKSLPHIHLDVKSSQNDFSRKNEKNRGGQKHSFDHARKRSQRKRGK